MVRPGRAWTILPGGSDRRGVFEESLLPHLDFLYTLSLRLAKDRDAASDLLQDAVLRAFQKFHQLRNPGAARAWFVRILTTTFLNRPGASRADPTEVEVEDIASLETPEAALLRRSEAEDIEEALAELPEPFRVAVMLADVEEFALRDIAALYNCPVGTVASRLARGREMLRRRLRHLRGAREVDA